MKAARIVVLDRRRRQRAASPRCWPAGRKSRRRSTGRLAAGRHRRRAGGQSRHRHRPERCRRATCSGSPGRRARRPAISSAKTTVPTPSRSCPAMIARAPFVAGEPIREAKLVNAKGSGFMAAILPTGMRAVSTQISPETGAGGFILPNDRVDVILTRRDRDAEKATGGERRPAKPFSAMSASWRSTRTSRKRTARRSWSARPRRSSFRRSRWRRWRWRSISARCRWRCAASPMPAATEARRTDDTGPRAQRQRRPVRRRPPRRRRNDERGDIGDMANSDTDPHRRARGAARRRRTCAAGAGTGRRRAHAGDPGGGERGDVALHPARHRQIGGHRLARRHQGRAGRRSQRSPTR